MLLQELWKKVEVEELHRIQLVLTGPRFVDCGDEGNVVLALKSVCSHIQLDSQIIVTL